jgi:hypothetical protein
MKNNIFTFFVALTLLVGCGEPTKNQGDKSDTLTSRDKSATPSEQTTKRPPNSQAKKYLFAETDDCSFQEQIKTSPAAKLILFDPKGIFPEELYEKSPSAILKKQLRDIEFFQQFIRLRFDFFVATQDCEYGAAVTSYFKIVSFPTILVIDEKGVILYKEEGMKDVQELIQDIQLLK